MRQSVPKFRLFAAAMASGGTRSASAAHDPSSALTLLAMSLGYGVVQLDVTIVNTALDRIGASLGGGVSELQWIVSAYTIAFAAFILTAGALGDRFGAKRMFIAGFAIFTSASLVCALAGGAIVLIAARAMQGLGAAVLVPNSLALLSHAYPDARRRGRAVGIWAAGASLALTAGPLAGGLLIAFVGWRSIFLVNLPIGIAGLWLSWRYATETAQNRRREIDLPGQIAAIGALGCLAGAIIEAGVLGWSNGFVVAGFAIAVALVALFVMQERRSPHPMLPLSFFAQPVFTFTALVGLMVNIAFYGLIFVFSLLWQERDGYSALRAGLAFLPMTAAVLATNVASGRVAALIGTRPVILTGLAGMAAGCAGLLFAGPGTPFAQIVGQLVLLGGGIGLLVPPMPSTVMGSVDRSRSGVASGTLNTMRQAGSVLGVAVFGSLIAARGHFTRGFHVSLVIALAVICVAAGLTAAITPASANEP